MFDSEAVYTLACCDASIVLSDTAYRNEAWLALRNGDCGGKKVAKQNETLGTIHTL